MEEQPCELSVNRLRVFTSEEERTPGKSAVDEGNVFAPSPGTHGLC